MGRGQHRLSLARGRHPGVEDRGGRVLGAVLRSLPPREWFQRRPRAPVPPGRRTRSASRRGSAPPLLLSRIGKRLRDPRSTREPVPRRGAHGSDATDRARILWVVPIHRVDEGAEVLSELDRGECPRARLPRPADCWHCSMITVHLEAPSCMRILRMSCGPRTSCATQEVCDPACCTGQTSGGRSDPIVTAHAGRGAPVQSE